MKIEKDNLRGGGAIEAEIECLAVRHKELILQIMIGGGVHQTNLLEEGTTKLVI